MTTTTRARTLARAGLPSPARRVLDYYLLLWRRTWRGTAFSGFLSPLLYLAAIGYGLGSLVDAGGRGVAGTTYVAYVAPGVLAATAMQTAASETTWPVLGAVRWQRTYYAMLATPVGTVDIVLGHLAFVALRILAGVVCFFVVAVLLGAVLSWAGIAAVPFALLTGLAFATPIYAFAATQDRPTGFSLLFRLGIIPMFLFSGTFFPVSQLPALIQPVAWLTPLWHGVELCRAATLGQLAAIPTALHVAYLAVWAAVGLAVALRTLARRMVV